MTASCAGGPGHVTAVWIEARCVGFAGAAAVLQPAITTPAHAIDIRYRYLQINVVSDPCCGIGDTVYAVFMDPQHAVYCSRHIARNRWYARQHRMFRSCDVT